MTKELVIDDLASWLEAIPTILSWSGDSRCWCLHGDLGAGKTSLVQALMLHLGSNDPVSSPTYAILNHYTTPKSGMENVYHLDLYRLEDVEEVIDLGWQEFEHSSDLMIIEWPDVAAPLLREDAFHLKITTMGSGRKVVLL